MHAGGNMNASGFLFFVAWFCAISSSSQFVGGQVAIPFISLETGDFSCGTGGNLRCSGNATTTTDGVLKLTPDPPGRQENYTYFLNTVGLALYKTPVVTLNHTSNELATLNISFSFRIEAGNGAGDGLVFVFLADETWMGGAGSSFGVFSASGRSSVSTLAVEFDTYMNIDVNDPDNNHVGIDVTSTTSERTAKLPYPLDSTERVYAWVDYDPSSFLLAVTVSPTSQKLNQPTVSHKIVPDVFNAENVWVGFSAANGYCQCFNYYTVYDFSFRSSFASASLPPAAAPDKQAPNSTAVPTSGNSSASTVLIAVVTTTAAGVILGACLLVFCVRRKQRRKRIRRRLLFDTPETPREYQIAGISHSPKMYSYDLLCAATNNFSESLKLGEGGFGSVYRGSIPGTDPELLVAVKKVSSESRQGEREFLAEVSTIGMLRQRNLVQLLGWCYEGEGLFLLVYEYMPNGSLDRHLFPRTVKQETDPTSILPWEMRFKILGGLAAALQYLHEGWRQQVIHRDVKSSNIMLDENFNAMLGDFGLARMADHCKNLATTCVAGTYGYVAPEAPMTGKYTVKTDVFSFGAVCLEIVCGRKVHDRRFPDDEVLLVDYVWRKLSEDALLSVVDRRLQGEYDVQQVETVLLLGLLCSHPKPGERPTMHGAIEILSRRVELPLIPKTKPEGEYYAYPYNNREKKMFLSDSGSNPGESNGQNHASSCTNSTTSKSTSSFTKLSHFSS